MRDLSRCIRLNCMRMLRLLPVIMTGTVILCVSLLCVAGLLVGGSESKHKSKFKIGVVGDFDNYFFSSGVEAIQSLDTTRYIIELESVSKEEAEEGFADGKYISYIVIPDGFMDSVRYGRNDKKLTYVYGDDVQDIAGMAMEEIVDSYSDYITGSQTAIYAAQRVNESLGNSDMDSDQLIDLNTRYISTVLNREKMCEVTDVGISSGLSVSAYYFCGIMVFFLFIAGIGSCMYFMRRNSSFQLFCISRGYDNKVQLIGEYIPYYVIMSFVLVIVWGFLTVAMGQGLIIIDEWNDAQIAGMWGLLPRMIPVLVMITVIHFLIYELMADGVGSILFLFIFSIGMGYVSGCFYPKQFFPEAVQVIGSLLPAGVAADYMAGCINGDIAYGSMVMMLAYSLVGIVGVYLLRVRNCSQVEVQK